jgi:hypothetical protein
VQQALEFRKTAPIDLPDRPAAQLTLSLGGEVIARDRTGMEITLKAGDRLPTRAFRVRSLSLPDGKARTDETVARLRVPALTSLVGLHLGGTAITDASLVHIRGARVQYLQLPFTRVTGQGMEQLITLPSLKSLTLDGCREVKNADLRHVAKLTTLTHLSLCDTPFTDPGLVHLETLTNLEHLELLSTNVSGATLAGLKGLTRLKVIDARCPVNDAGLAAFASLPALQSLNVEGAIQITDSGLAALRGNTTLRFLGLGATNITDAAIPHLVTLTGLTNLAVDRTKLTEAGLQRLRTALPKCEIFPKK